LKLLPRPRASTKVMREVFWNSPHPGSGLWSRDPRAGPRQVQPICYNPAIKTLWNVRAGGANELTRMGMSGPPTRKAHPAPNWKRWVREELSSAPLSVGPPPSARSQSAQFKTAWAPLSNHLQNSMGRTAQPLKMVADGRSTWPPSRALSAQRRLAPVRSMSAPGLFPPPVGVAAPPKALGSGLPPAATRPSKGLFFDSAVSQLKGKLEDELYTRHSSLTDAFRKGDEDKSGTISREEVGRVLVSYGVQADDATVDKLFADLDHNGDGEITLQEFQRALGAGTQTDAIFGRNDTQVTSSYVTSPNFGGQVLWSDNLRHAKRQQVGVRAGWHEHKLVNTNKEATSQQLQGYKMQLQDKIYSKYRRLTNAFRTMDEDKSGHLSKDEIVAAVEGFNLNIPLNHIQQLVDTVVDTNGDGQIDYNEFAASLKQQDMQQIDIVGATG